MSESMQDIEDPNYDKAIAIIERALQEVAGLFADSTGEAQMLIGDFVLVSEWSSLSGHRYVTRYAPHDMPPWRRNGLIDWAMRDWSND